MSHYITQPDPHHQGFLYFYVGKGLVMTPHICFAMEFSSVHDAQDEILKMNRHYGLYIMTKDEIEVYSIISL